MLTKAEPQPLEELLLKPSQARRSIGDAAVMPIAEAREKAREIVAEIKTGLKPASPKVPQTVAEICEVYYQREVVKKGLRSAKEIRRTLDNHILPALGGALFEQLAKRDVTALLDDIEDEAGPCAADRTLTRVKKFAKWHENRHDDYVSPFTNMERRIAPKERERERILTDDEIRGVWAATETGTFGPMVRMLMLTGQRLEKVSTMKWSEIEDGVWRIPTAAREKGHGGDLVLQKMALSVLKAQPVFASNPFVFAGRKRHYNGFSKGKAQLDAELRLKQQWGLHNLRRTARSLMSRAGVAPHIAERVLGHAQRGVQGGDDCSMVAARHSWSFVDRGLKLLKHDGGYCVFAPEKCAVIGGSAYQLTLAMRSL